MTRTGTLAVALLALAPLALSDCRTGDATRPGDGPDPAATPRPCPVVQLGAIVSPEAALEIHRAAFGEPTNPDKLEAWKALLPRYGRYYVVEGDLLMLAPDLENYVIGVASRQSRFEAGEPVTPELHINVPTEGPGCWLPHERTLSFSIQRETFCPGNPNAGCAAYDAIIADLRQATEAWVAACAECNVVFDHQQGRDAAPSNDEVLFVVRKCDMSPTLGLAFFPRDEQEKRYLDIAPEAVTSRHSRVGILRHEIGHILGYRHEQLDEESGCFRRESGRWERLTDYDPKSVMHYPCGKAASQNDRLEISALDASGHREAYTERCAP